MNKTSTYLFLASAVSFVFLSGCASSRSGAGNGPVEAQMGVLADEVTRLDQALQETRAQLQQEQARVAELESRLGVSSSSGPVDSAPAYSSASTEPYSGIYRTPSGFELPSASVQKALKNAGYYNGDVDGKIGPETRESVRKFQSDNGLTPDGIIGKTTWNKLKTYLN